MFLLKALYNVIIKLERHAVLTITIETISKVTKMMWPYVQGNQSRLAGQLINEIYEERVCHELMYKANTLKWLAKEMEKCLNLIKNQLRQVKKKLAKKKKTLALVSNYPIKIFKSHHTSK